MKLLSLGLDYRRYARFRLLTPRVEHFMGGKRRLLYVSRKEAERVASRDELVFCIDFVLESALRLQEFDFDNS